MAGCDMQLAKDACGWVQRAKSTGEAVTWMFCSTHGLVLAWVHHPKSARDRGLAVVWMACRTGGLVQRAKSPRGLAAWRTGGQDPRL